MDQRTRDFSASNEQDAQHQARILNEAGIQTKTIWLQELKTTP
jgi:hypothetical protein